MLVSSAGLLSVNANPDTKLLDLSFSVRIFAGIIDYFDTGHLDLRDHGVAERFLEEIRPLVNRLGTWRRAGYGGQLLSAAYDCELFKFLLDDLIPPLAHRVALPPDAPAEQVARAAQLVCDRLAQLVPYRERARLLETRLWNHGWPDPTQPEPSFDSWDRWAQQDRRAPLTRQEYTQSPQVRGKLSVRVSDAARVGDLSESIAIEQSEGRQVIPTNPVERNRIVRDYLRRHKNDKKPPSVRSVAKALGLTHATVARTIAWKSYAAKKKPVQSVRATSLTDKVLVQIKDHAADDPREVALSRELASLIREQGRDYKADQRRPRKRS